MTNKSILIGGFILTIVDIVLLFYLITRPSKDQVHGGLGEALMAIYGLAAIILVILYQGVVVLLYRKKTYKTIKVMLAVLVIVNLYAVLVFSA